MSFFSNVLGTIGQTPLIYLKTVSEEVGTQVFAKVEAFNPGHSAKDRIAKYMIELAEQEGRLKPGGTVIEASSGNTGYSLAMVASLKGYKTVITVPSKISKEKLNLLKAMGAMVVICPKEAAADDPESYYSRAVTLSKEIPNSCYLDQNFHPANTEAHYRTTGPEIWGQMGGRMTHFLCASGTGGTISGTSRFLKEMDPKIRIIGIDAYGSVLKKYHETNEFDKDEIYSNTLEGVGKSIIPGNTDFDVIDQYIKVGDRESALMARQLAREEGLLVGYSSGAVAAGLYKIMDAFDPDDRVVLLFSDHGSRYLSKIFDDEWMRNQGFIDSVDDEGSPSSRPEVIDENPSIRQRVLASFRELVSSTNILS